MTHYTIDTAASPAEGLKILLTRLLEERQVDAVVAPAATPWSALPMPHLFTDTAAMDRIAPRGRPGSSS